MLFVKNMDLHVCSRARVIKFRKKIQPPLCVFFPEVMHGGLFKRDDVKLDELKTIDRNRQPGEEGKYHITWFEVFGWLGCQ